MTKLQTVLIVLGSAVLFQLFSALVTFSAEDMADPKAWFFSLLVGVLNAVGVAGVALFTTGGLALPKGLGDTDA